MTIFGDRLQTRAFSYIDDVAPIIARSPLVGEAYQQVFNIGADQPYTVLALANQVAKAFGIEPCIEHLPPRKEVMHAFASHQKLQRVFNPPSPVALEVGINGMAKWARQHGPLKPSEYRQLEVPIDLPPSWTEKEP